MSNPFGDSCRLLLFCSERADRGLPAAEVFVDGSKRWMDSLDIKVAIAEFGELQGLADANEAYWRYAELDDPKVSRGERRPSYGQFPLKDTSIKIMVEDRHDNKVWIPGYYDGENWVAKDGVKVTSRVLRWKYVDD